MTARVAWLSFAPLRKAPTGWTSDVASARYRLTIPARALSDLGVESTVIDVVRLGDPMQAARRVGQAQAAIFGKLVGTPHELAVLGPRTLELAGVLARRGVRVVADFSDDVFREPERRPYFRSLANIADDVVTTTEALARILREETPSPVHVVTDPVEGPCGEPTVAPSEPLRLLWYGHPTNLETLEIARQQLARIAGERPLAVTLVTTPGPAAEAAVARLKALPGTACRLVPWNTHAVFDALRVCDAVFIPSDPAQRHRAVKSPNRFIEALWAGRFVVAHPLPAYEALADYGWVGEDLGVGLEWMMREPGAALARIRGGQAAIETGFTPAAVARQWRAAILAQA